MIIFKDIFSNDEMGSDTYPHRVNDYLTSASYDICRSSMTSSSKSTARSSLASPELSMRLSSEPTLQLKVVVTMVMIPRLSPPQTVSLPTDSTLLVLTRRAGPSLSRTTWRWAINFHVTAWRQDNDDLGSDLSIWVLTTTLYSPAMSIFQV